MSPGGGPGWSDPQVLKVDGEAESRAKAEHDECEQHSGPLLHDWRYHLPKTADHTGWLSREQERLRVHALSEAIREAEAAQPNPDSRWTASLNPAGGDKPALTPGVDLIHGREHDDTITPAEARALARMLLLAADRAESTVLHPKETA